MTNDPADNEQREHAASEEDDEARRVVAFQLKCAAMRETTQLELTRLAAKRASVRAQLGISSDRMAMWCDEHQRMLHADALAASTQPEQ